MENGALGPSGQSARSHAGMVHRTGTETVKAPFTWERRVWGRITRYRCACPGYVQWMECGYLGVSGACVAKLAVTAVRPGLVPVTGRSMEEPTVQDLAWRRETVTHTPVLVSGITSKKEGRSFVCATVDGEWQLWSDWSSCTVTCGGGNQSRTRKCQGPFHGGQLCVGAAEDFEDCCADNCPKDGYFSTWSPWWACDVTCGGSLQDRNRTCVGPFYGGQNCEGPSLDNRTCNTHSCPINGVLTPWSAWSSCSVTCGGGVANRSRECDGPYHGGWDCEGDLVEKRACNEESCPENGLWQPWSPWGTCSASCAGGEQSRERTCDGTRHGGTYCQGEHNQTRDCNIHNCPVHGVWREWSAWDLCNVTCGGGHQVRNRTCDGPYYQGLDCQGPAEENQTCNTQPCPVDGFYGAWSAWSQCSAPCGGGTQSRDRPCTPPQHQGQDCQGPSNQTQECNTQPCPVNGFYLAWSEWSECPVPCGGGVQWRNRTCEQPKHGGADCQGPDNVTQECNTGPCPIDGVWLPWSEWSVCSSTCGGGQQKKSRLCQQPQHGGQACLGPEVDSRSCAEDPCP
ncbi:sco-spondin-like, partial [Plakobranchus ocellatus]